MEKKDGQLREHTVSSRLNATELAFLDALRGGRTRGSYVRQVILGQKPPELVPQPNREKYIELARTAAALSQLARRANLGDTDIIVIQEQLKNFRFHLLDMTWESHHESENF